MRNKIVARVKTGNGGVRVHLTTCLCLQSNVCVPVVTYNDAVCRRGLTVKPKINN